MPESDAHHTPSSAQILASTLAAAPEPRSQDTLLVASLLHLMSHYSARGDGEQPCVKLASVIERHLCALSRLPSIDPVLRATCEQLADQWAAVVDAKLPAPTPVRQPLLARFMKGGWNGKAAPLAG